MWEHGGLSSPSKVWAADGLASRVYNLFLSFCPSFEGRGERFLFGFLVGEWLARHHSMSAIRCYRMYVYTIYNDGANHIIMHED